MRSDSENTRIREEAIFQAEVQSGVALSRKKGIWLGRVRDATSAEELP